MNLARRALTGVVYAAVMAGAGLACAGERPSALGVMESPAVSLTTAHDAVDTVPVGRGSEAAEEEITRQAPPRSAAVSEEVDFPFFAPTLAIQLYSGDCEIGDDREPHGICL